MEHMLTRTAAAHAVPSSLGLMTTFLLRHSHGTTSTLVGVLLCGPEKSYLIVMEGVASSYRQAAKPIVDINVVTVPVQGVLDQLTYLHQSNTSPDMIEFGNELYITSMFRLFTCV